MYLTKVEERMLGGEFGEAMSVAMKILVKVGEALGASRLIEVSHVHISGVSYSNIGEPGLEYLEKLASTKPKFSAYTTVNPSCVDLSLSSKIVSLEDWEKQAIINGILESMGSRTSYTCTPYLLRRPFMLEHLAWGESSAVAMANSFYGAFTNREGGPLTIAAAIAGRTYMAGLHLMSERRAKYVVKTPPLNNEAEASLLGLYIGERYSEITQITGASEWSHSIVKEFLAASAASGSHALVPLDGVTPRGTYVVEEGVERTTIDRRELEYYYDNVSKALELGEETLVYIGCPHLSLSELRQLSIMFDGRRLKRGVHFLVTVPGTYRAFRDIDRSLKKAGVEVAIGTCPIVSKITVKPDVVLTNSGKALFYLSKLHKFNVSLASLVDIVKLVSEK
ncbi:MAG: aconitase X catalytic domain-containing protein [Desulfurococcaceae archaeon]|nr:aconitase X catalytic domain-containing protein [Sulfolobales archaeon]MDW8169740.1 aconitase X catalytic domain-containing protein [Desulfurococcaceae archaeon]